MHYGPAFTILGRTMVAGLMIVLGALSSLCKKGYVGFKISVKVWLPHWPDWAWKGSWKLKGDKGVSLLKEIRGLLGVGLGHSEAQDRARKGA